MADSDLLCFVVLVFYYLPYSATNYPDFLATAIISDGTAVHKKEKF